MMIEEIFRNFPIWIGYRVGEKRTLGSDEHIFFPRWLTVGTSIHYIRPTLQSPCMPLPACLNGHSGHKKVDKNTNQFVKIHVGYLMNKYSCQQSTRKYVSIFPWSKLILWLSHFDLGVMVDFSRCYCSIHQSHISTYKFELHQDNQISVPQPWCF